MSWLLLPRELNATVSVTRGFEPSDSHGREKLGGQKARYDFWFIYDRGKHSVGPTPSRLGAHLLLLGQIGKMRVELGGDFVWDCP